MPEEGQKYAREMTEIYLQAIELTERRPISRERPQGPKRRPGPGLWEALPQAIS
jgi:hypothetical protein